MSQYIIEFRQIGNYIKVSAVDPVTLKETFIVVPAGKKISRRDMTTLAVKKLESVIKRAKEASTSDTY